MVRGSKSDNIFTSVLTVLRGISDTKQVLIEYVMTERDFQIETFSARPVSFIRSALLSFWPVHRFRFCPIPLTPLPSLAFESFLPFTQCYSVFPTELPPRFSSFSPPLPRGRPMKAHSYWLHRSDPPSVFCQLPTKQYSFSSSFDLPDPLEYGSYLPLQLPLLWSLPLLLTCTVGTERPTAPC